MKKTALLLLASFCLKVTVFAQTDRITVHMIGDSTMADKPVIPANPKRGWGQMLHMFFKDTVRVENYARNGRRTKSFLAEGRWDKVVTALKPRDFIIIQFGHNDDKIANLKGGTALYGEDTKNPLRFISDAREHQAIPILATPVSRRSRPPQGRMEKVS